MKLDQQHSNLKQHTLVNNLTKAIKKASPNWTSLFLYLDYLEETINSFF